MSRLAPRHKPRCPLCQRLPEARHCKSPVCTWFKCDYCRLIFTAAGRSIAYGSAA